MATLAQTVETPDSGISCQEELISPSQIADFRRDGVIFLKGRFEMQWLDRLSLGVEKNFNDPGPYATRYTPPGDPGGFYDDYCNWQRNAEYREFLYDSPAAEIAGKLMQSGSARLYHEHVLVKEPGTRETTPWHHDLPYYGVDADQACSIWLPLDPVPANACPEFVAGSHRTGVLYYPRFFCNSQNYMQGIHEFETVPDIDAHRENYRIVSWALEPGDCIVFHMRTLHGAPSTIGSTSRRRGFSTRWIGDDARFASRPWPTSPPFPEVDLLDGEKMIHPSFPVLWSQNTP